MYAEESEFIWGEYVPGRFKQKDSPNLALDLYYPAVSFWISQTTAALVVNGKEQDASEPHWLNLSDWGWGEGFRKAHAHQLYRGENG